MTALDRRHFLIVAGTLAGAAAARAWPSMSTRQGATMFGVIGKISAVPGQRDALAAGFSNRAETRPLGGPGLPSVASR